MPVSKMMLAESLYPIQNQKNTIALATACRLSGIIAAPFLTCNPMKTRVFSIAAVATALLLVSAAWADHNSAESLAKRVGAVGSLNIMTEEEAAAARAEAAAAAAEAAPSEMAAGPVDPAGVYNTACAACHAAGVAGAPKLGDAGAWAARAEQGLEVLIDHAINGFQGEAGVMPARGGNASLSDEQVAAAVEYMLEQSQ